MADTVRTQVLESNGVYYMVNCTNASDGTGESAVVKVDKSSLTNQFGVEPKSLTVEWIEYSVSPHDSGVTDCSLTIAWDHTADSTIAVLQGNGCKHYEKGGGLRDPKLNDSTGDILFTTNNFSSGDSYDVTMLLRLEA